MRAGVKRLLLVGPCGMGKTVLAATMAQHASAKGKRTQFWVHRKELTRQSVRTFVEAADLHVGIIGAGFPSDASAPVQVCQVQSLRKRADKVKAPDIIIVDEAHHQPSATYAKLAAAYPDAFFIGVTASPVRMDGKGLRPFFDEMIVGPSTSELIDAGFLSPYRFYAPSVVDMSKVHTVAGDFNKKEASEKMRASSVVGDAVSTYRTHCEHGKALLFAWSIESSMALADAFNAAGVPALHVDGETDDTLRLRAMQDFEAGRVRVLCSVDLLGEGIDVISVDAVFLLRPTQSLGVYIQQTGRGLRIAPGKDHVKIFDHANNHTRHGLPDDPRAWTLDGISKDAVSKPQPLKRCASCFRVTGAARALCPFCGAAYPVKARKVVQVAGELAETELSALRANAWQDAREAQSLAELQAIAKRCGYKPGWAWFRWKLKQQRPSGARGLPWTDRLSQAEKQPF